MQALFGEKSMSYSTGSHTVFYHRYHIVWITKYRYKVLLTANMIEILGGYPSRL